MASSAPAVVAPTSFDDLRLGRSAQFVVARLLRFWDSRNIKKQGEFMGITLLFLDEQVLFHLFTIKLFEKDQPFDSVNFISSVLVTFFFLRILWSMGLYLPLAPVTTVQVYEVVPSSKFQALRLLDALTCTRSQKVHSWSGSCHKQPLMKSWSMLPLSTSKNSCSGSLSIFKHLLTRTWNSQVYFLYMIVEISLFSFKIVCLNYGLKLRQYMCSTL